MLPKQPVVSIITVNFNQTELTCALLDSIRLQEYPHIQVLVVDNASRENPAEIIRSRYPEVHFIHSGQNLGFAGGNNLALPYVSGDLLFYINNDAELAPNAIETLVQHFHAHPKTGALSPLICYFERPPELVQYAGMTPVHPLTARNRTIGERTPNTGQYAQPMPTAYAHGAAMMIPRCVLEHVGPMYEGYFLYYEELDWCARIRQAGYEIWVEPRAKIWHKESATVQKMGAMKTFYLTRNRIWFMRRNFSGFRFLFFVVFLCLVTIPKNSLLYLLRRQMQPLTAFWRGIVHGLSSYQALKI
jgi:GT2 family glycosyltransferase